MLLATALALTAAVTVTAEATAAAPPYVTPGPSSYELYDYNPVASDGATVMAGGNARFTVLTPQMIRMEYSSGKSFEDRPTVAILNRNLPVPTFTHDITNGVLTIKTSSVELKYTVGSAFNADGLSVSPIGSSSAFTGWHYGQADPNNLLGTIKSLDQLGVETLNCTLNANKTVHDESLHCTWGLVSRSGWAIVNDTENWALTKGGEWWDSVNADTEDLYLLAHGHDYKGALKDFAKISGAMPMFPRYALGLWYTRWYDYNNLDVKQVVNRYREHSLPLDVYVTDMNWHKKDNWGGYTFDPNLYPYPEDTFGWLHDLGLYTAANLHDANGIGSYEAMYPEMCKATGFDCSQNKSIPFSIVNKTYVYALEDIVLGAVSKQLDFWWIDWQQGGTQGGAAGGYQNPTVWTNKIRVTDPKRQGKEERGVVLARWGGLGTHRYQVGFSGDVDSLSWDRLAYQPYFSLTAANVLYGYWSHDIEGPADDHELYTRWVQWAAYSGVHRSHDRGMSGGGCAKTGGPLMGSTCSNVRVWETPDEFYEPMRDAMRQRAENIPYTYSAAWASHTEGLGLLRPMYYEFPELDAAYNSTPAAAQYFFGPDLVVAPVTAQSDPTTLLASTEIWVPPGTWFDLTFGQLISAPAQGTTIVRDWDITEIPRFARGGAVLPSTQLTLGDTIGVAMRQYTSLTFTVVPGASSGSCDVYEDDGLTRAYLNGDSVMTTVSYTSSDTTTSIKVSSNGSYATFPSSRPYTMRLMARPFPTEVKIDGQTCNDCWSYDGPEVTLVITTANVSTSQDHTIDVTFASSTPSLSGLKGAMSRANLAKQNLDMTRTTPGSHNTKGGKLSQFSSIGDGLSYAAVHAPSDFTTAVTGAKAAYAAAVDEINQMLSTSTSVSGVDTVENPRNTVGDRVYAPPPPPPPGPSLDRNQRAKSLLASVHL